MTKIKLSALVCAILVGGQQLVAKDLKDIIFDNAFVSFVDYAYYNNVFIENSYVDSDNAIIDIVGKLDVNNSGDIEYGGPSGIKIDKSNLNVAGEVNVENSYTELNNSSNANFKDKLTLISSDMLLKNSSILNVGGVADFEGSALIIKDNSNTTINGKLTVKDSGTIEFVNGEFAVNDGGIKIAKSNLNVGGAADFSNSDTSLDIDSKANFKDKLTLDDSAILLKNRSSLNVEKEATFSDSALAVQSGSNVTINGKLTVKDSGDLDLQYGALESVAGEGIWLHGNSTLSVKGDTSLTNSNIVLLNSKANFEKFDMNTGVAMLVGGNLAVNNEANFDKAAFILTTGSSAVFNKNLTTKKQSDAYYNSMIFVDSSSKINVKGNFENHGDLIFGLNGANNGKIIVDGKTTLGETTTVLVYSEPTIDASSSALKSEDLTNFKGSLVLIESQGGITNNTKAENVYAVYFDPNSDKSDASGFVEYDQSIIDAKLILSDNGKKLLYQIGMSQDMQDKPVDDKVGYVKDAAQAFGITLTTQDLDIISSLFAIGDTKGNGVIATEGIKLAAQAAQGNQEAAQIISKTAKAIQKNSQDSINATSNLINTFNLATKNEVGKRISNVTTRSNASQLASFIESLEGQKFADASNGVLLSMMADEMAEYQNSFYLNALGAKGDFKDGTNPKIYGAILGYDRMIDDLLVGGYFSYTNSETKNITLDSNVYELGLYSRYFLDNNEFGFNIAGGYGKNDLSYTQNIFGVNKFLQSKFDLAYITLGLDYGYRFAINDNASIKPYIGADYLYSKTQNYTLKDETGADFQKIQSNTAKNLKAKLGLEMVKRFDEISIYADAKIKRDLINDEGLTRSSFAGSSAGFNIKGNDKKYTNFALDTGIAYNATKNLSINLNLGADINSDDKIYSTSFGATYKF